MRTSVLKGSNHRAKQVLFLAALLFSAAIGSLAAQENERPNILWIIAEDLNPDLGVYGEAAVRTPSLDALAEAGIRFTRAFATGTACSPSRSAFITGVYQTTIGAQHHRMSEEIALPLPDGVDILPERLQRAGYFTANVREIDEHLRGTGKDDWNFRYEGPAWDSDKWSDLKDNQPFFAQINLPEAHRGPQWGKKRRTDLERIQFPPYYPDHPVTREDWAFYLNAIEEADRKVGLILKKLEEDDLDKNTIVLFFGDNSREMLRAKQWCYDSGLHVPLLVYLPPGIPYSRDYEPGTVSDRLVSLIDLYATTLALAGVDQSQLTHGRIFIGPDAGPPRRYVFGATDWNGGLRLHGRTVRSERYRYIRNGVPEESIIAAAAYRQAMVPMVHLMQKLHAENRLNPIQAALLRPRPAEELYDLATDPFEIHNLAGSPTHEDVLNELRSKLDEWIEETKDTGQQPERPEVTRFFEEYASRSARTYADQIEALREYVWQVDERYVQWLREGQSGE